MYEIDGRRKILEAVVSEEKVCDEALSASEEVGFLGKASNWLNSSWSTSWKESGKDKARWFEKSALR